jgi:energy-coupling factor transporter ATP-binding protein EcfA2
MFRKHWGLRESPFRGTLDWRLFFPSPTHDEALARLHFLVEERRRLGLLLGPTGCGKSLVLEVFARRLRRHGAQIANVNLLGADLHEFLWLAAAELGVNPDRRDDPFRLWRGVIDRLAENRYQQLDTVLLLDDADQATPPVLDGFTGDQRFFLGFAQVWARKYRDDELRKRLLTDPHSPSEYRCNGVVRNMPQFVAAFDVKPGDGLYLPPEKQVRIW